MKIKIIETNEIKTINLIDPKTNVNWANDLLGNHDALNVFDEDGMAMMIQEDFEWWVDLVDRYQAAENRSYEIWANLNGPDQLAFEDRINHITGIDLENYPEAVEGFCDEWEGK